MAVRMQAEADRRQVDSRSDWKPETTDADLARAAEHDRWRSDPAGGARVVEHVELLDYAASAVERAARAMRANLDPDTRADLAADLMLKIGPRHEWAPLAREVMPSYLERQARALIRAEYRRVSKIAPTETDTPGGGEPVSLLAQAAGIDGTPTGYHLAAVDVDAEGLADALGLSEGEAAVIAAGLSGYGGALEYAVVAGISHEAARQRLSRGKRDCRLRWPTPSALAETLAQIAPDLAERARTEDRPTLDAPSMAALVAVDTVRRYEAGSREVVTLST